METFDTSSISNFIRRKTASQQTAGHVVRMPLECFEKQLIFNDDKYHRIGRVTPSLLEQVLKFNWFSKTVKNRQNLEFSDNYNIKQI